jgi:hypothetical protein
MHLLLLALLMFACVVAGTAQPVFLVGAYFLFVWISVALFARGVRWLVGLTTPAAACAAGNPRAAHERSTSTGQARVCPDSRCGRVNPGGARFCAQCGRRLA